MYTTRVKHTDTMTISLHEVDERYPNGIYVARHGAYYFLDMDGDLGYFVAMADGTFEDEVGYVEFDTIDEDDAEECRRIAAYLAFYQ